MRWQGMTRAFWKVTLYSIIMIPLKRTQLWKQVVKLSNVLCGIMKNYDLSLKGKGVSFFLTTLLDFNNSLPDILIYLFANIHGSSIDPVIKHLTRVTWNKVCKKLIFFFCPQLQLFGSSDPHVYSQNPLQLLEGKNKRFLFILRLWIFLWLCLEMAVVFWLCTVASIFVWCCSTFILVLYCFMVPRCRK